MANNYLQFSTVILYHTAAQKDWLLAAFAAASERDEGAICQHEDEPHDCNVWVYAEEYGDVERLATLVSDYQQAFQLEEPWLLSWSESCSKMRLDEFSGGAVAVKRGEVKWFNPICEAEKWANAQAEGR